MALTQNRSGLMWLLCAGLALLVGGLTGYAVRGYIQNPLSRKVSQQLADDERKLRDFQAKAASDAQSGDTRRQTLESDLSTASAQLETSKQAMDRLRKTSTESAKKMAEYQTRQDEVAKQLESVKAQAEQFRLRGEQADAQRTRVGDENKALQAENANLKTQLSRAAKNANSAPPAQDVGYLIWVGDNQTKPGKQIIEVSGNTANAGKILHGSLPKTPCEVFSADPGRTDIRELPSSGNGFHLRFSYKKAPDSMTFFWVATKQ